MRLILSILLDTIPAKIMARKPVILPKCPGRIAERTFGQAHYTAEINAA